MIGRSAFAIFAAVLLLLSSPAAVRAEYPTQPIRIIVAWPPGGVTDTVARVIADQLSKAVKQPVVVDNRPGANGNIGTQAAARMPADGYTLQVVTAETHAINPHVYAGLNYDVGRDFEPIALLARSNFVLATRVGLDVKNVQDLIALAQASPGKLSAASYGIGSTSHLTLAEFEERTNTSFVHVPYRGVSPAVNAILTSEVDIAFVTPHIVVNHQKEGKAQIIGTAATQRMPIVPDTLTFGEQGIADFTGGNWYGVVAPRGIPAEAKALLEKEMKRIAASDIFARHASGIGIAVEYLDSAQFDAFLKSENERWDGIVKSRKIEAAQ